MSRRLDRAVTILATLVTLLTVVLVVRDNWPIHWAALTGSDLVAFAAPVLVVITIWCCYVERRRTDRAEAELDRRRTKTEDAYEAHYARCGGTRG